MSACEGYFIICPCAEFILAIASSLIDHREAFERAYIGISVASFQLLNLTLAESFIEELHRVPMHNEVELCISTCAFVWSSVDTEEQFLGGRQIFQ